MRLSRKNLFLLFFYILAVDLSVFALFYVYPQIFAEYLIASFEPDVLGLIVIGGFIIVIASSVVLLFLTYKELRTIMRKPLKESVSPQSEEVKQNEEN